MRRSLHLNGVRHFGEIVGFYVTNFYAPHPHPTPIQTYQLAFTCRLSMFKQSKLHILKRMGLMRPGLAPARTAEPKDCRKESNRKKSNG